MEVGSRVWESQAEVVENMRAAAAAVVVVAAPGGGGGGIEVVVALRTVTEELEVEVEKK